MSDGPLAKTYLADAIVEVLCAAHDFYLHAHEIDRQVAPVYLREPHRVLLRRDNEFRLAFLAAVDRVQDFLLRETVMVGKPLGIHHRPAQRRQALLKTLRLRNPAQRRHLAPPYQIQPVPVPREHVLKIERMMDALDDARRRIILVDPLPQFLRVPVALRDEYRVRARQM